MSRWRPTPAVLAIVVVAATILGACQSSVSPSPGSGGPPSSDGLTPSSGPPSVATPGPGDGAGPGASTRYVPEAGTKGGSIRIGDWQEANQFNPYILGQQTESNVASAAWATLVIQINDGRFEPNLAAAIPTTANGSVKVPGDGGDAMTVTWKLRDGLKWSDGQPLTCDDFKYAWEWVLDPDNVGVATGGLEDIRTFECASTTDMIWHFSLIYEGYLTLMTAPLPRHYLSKFPIKDQVTGAGFRPNEISKLPVSGAFSFDTVTPGAELRLKKNPNYKSWATGKPAHLDSLVWKWYGDVDAMIAAMKNGEIDVATDLLDVDTPKVKGFGSRVKSIPSLAAEVLWPNWSDASDVDPVERVGGCSRNAAVADRGTGCPMADPAMREAVSLAIDKEAIRKRLLGGTVKGATTSISPSAWFHFDQPAPGFDPAEARRVLDTAGWRVGLDGIRAKDSLRATIELCATKTDLHTATATLIVGWLDDVGIAVVPNLVAPDDLYADDSTATFDTPCALTRSNFDLAEVATTGPIDPLGSFFSFHSSQRSPTGTNVAAVDDPEIDAALTIVEGSVDFAVIRDAMREFQILYVEKTVEIPLYFRQQIDLRATKVRNFRATPNPNGLTWNAVDWYIKR